MLTNKWNNLCTRIAWAIASNMRSLEPSMYASKSLQVSSVGIVVTVNTLSNVYFPLHGRLFAHVKHLLDPWQNKSRRNRLWHCLHSVNIRHNSQKRPSVGIPQFTQAGIFGRLLGGWYSILLRLLERKWESRAKNALQILKLTHAQWVKMIWLVHSLLSHAPHAD